MAIQGVFRVRAGFGLADDETMQRQRIQSAVVLVVPFLLLVQFGSPFQFSLLIGLAVALAAWEFAGLCPAGDRPALRISTALAAVAWQAAMLRDGVAVVAAVLVVGALLWGALGRAEFGTGVQRAAWLVLGTAYAGGLLGSVALLRDLPDGRQFIFFLALTTWAGDTGAFYVGRALGRHPLAPRLSPKKTVEGALGGAAATVAAAALGRPWIWPRFAWGHAILIGLVLAVAGMLGDLCESAVKRAAGVKDSGGLIPGHGGVLDRLDSVIFAGPVLYGLAWLGWV